MKTVFCTSLKVARDDNQLREAMRREKYDRASDASWSGEGCPAACDRCVDI